jgi:hypothetical protein
MILCMKESSLSKRPFLVALIVLGLAVATLANYLAWLGWDQKKDISPDGSISGPYQPWQVVGLVLGVVLISAIGGWRGYPWVASIVTAVVLTLCWSVDAVTDPGNDGLWPVGAITVAVGAFTGLTIVARLATTIRVSRPAREVG